MAGGRVRKSYPIGDINIRPLKVDQAGTPTVSGSTSNFQTFTSNGTMAAWNATTARALVDDIPPVVGASADGIAQINTASTEYVQLPMETFTAAPDHVLRAARWYWAPWAASATAATLGVRGYDGVAEVGQVGVADHGFDSSALMWLTRMNRDATSNFYLLTQAKCDALAARVGFSIDASPDVGIHAVMLELVTQPATVIGIMSGEDGAFNVYVRQDPVSGAVASYLCTTPPGTRGMTVSFTIDGADSSQYVSPNTTYEKVVGASSVDHVTSIGMAVDPTE